MAESLSGTPPFLELAPLQGLTSRLYRRVFFRHFGGFDAAMAPFVAAIGAAGRRDRHFKDILPPDPEGPALTPQVMANEAGPFLETAAVLAEAGYRELNWNLGCPYPMVAKKRRGSGLLPHPELVEAFLDEVCPRLPLALSVKLRLGRKDGGEIHRLAPVLNAHPLSRVILHPRLGVQMYRGRVDLDAFQAAAAEMTHSLFYNGDIVSAEGFWALAGRFPGIAGWMIGRGAAADPFLAEDIKGMPGRGDRLERVRAFHDELYSGYRGILSGPGHTLDKMKEFWRHLGPSLSGCLRELGEIASAKGFAAYESNVKRIFDRAEWSPLGEGGKRAPDPLRPC